MKKKFNDDFEITTKKWNGKSKTTVNWAKVAELYTEMRNVVLEKCEKCQAPKNEFDIGEYCEKHEKFEELDEIIAKVFLP